MSAERAVTPVAGLARISGYEPATLFHPSPGPRPVGACEVAAATSPPVT